MNYPCTRKRINISIKKYLLGRGDKVYTHMKWREAV